MNMFKRKEKVIVAVDRAEFRLIRDSLLALRDRLLAEGRCTDPVDELLLRILR
jgi:hypothetical protein